MTGKLLLVDDNEISRDSLTRRLQRQGYTVIAVDNGKDALDRINNEIFDLVLLDLEIPIISGLDVLRQTRKRQQPIELPIIVITTQQETRNIVQAFEAGASDCVTKPVDFGVVNARIRTHLALKRAEAVSRETEERYTLAVAGSNDGIWDWNLQTNTAFFSERWKSMLGYQPDEIGSQPDEWLERIHTEDREAVKAALAMHLEGQASHFESEHRVLHRDGSYRWMLSRGVAIRDEHDKPYRVAGSQTDITTAKVTDPLTGLPNRALFLDRLGCLLERAKRHQDLIFAVLFLDIDRFKEINDSLGHLAGDQLLISIAQRLQQCLRTSDSMSRPGHTLARLGGDEFTVILDELSDPMDALCIAERLMQAIKEPIPIGPHELHVGVSIGIAVNSFEASTPKDMLAQADTAMYSAKTRGRNRIEVFNPGMRASAVARIQLEHEMRRGIDHGEFLNWYQFIVCLKTGRLTGIEALVRWNHPTRGVIHPEQFMATAEQTGLIVPIGASLMTQACRDLISLRKNYRGDKPLTVSVNLSEVQFAQRELADQINQTLSATGLEAACLKLQITESMVMTDPDSSEEKLQRLKGLGVKLEIDDFGTGYSSLRYLAGYPVDALKIDRSFVRGMEQNPKQFEITRTIIGLAHNLGLEVVAEGIEAEEQRTLLRLMDCEYGQGYLISHPQDIASAHQWILQNSKLVGVPV